MRQQHVRLPIVGMLVAGLINLRQIDRKSQSRASLKKEVWAPIESDRGQAGIPRAGSGTRPRFLALGSRDGEKEETM